MKTEINADEWRAALRAAEGDLADKVPPGWLSAHDLAKRFAVQRPRAAVIGRTLFDAGRAERRLFRIATGYGVRSVVHYKLKK